ncbi:FBD-associated F-box protein At4g10400-like [Papaver somniferum]|uniref:FBD-associated F-box protein At4g10400-like n=1 Tax=Papaver somniferum TaxID=3469 RepID=UPI000E7032C3|nr:FBD-associated F-box protein At4g10400-like [Papaver somniferum]
MFRKKKLLKGMDTMIGVEEEDRISKLPDPLLCHILSFLPFQHVVATSILAKRWRFIWNSVPILKITHCLSTDSAKDRYLHNKHFVNFMDRMFVFRDLSTIKYFYLHTYISDDYNMNSWISVVIRRKVEEIHLWLPHPDEYSPFLIPSSLFTCESLVTLRMSVNVVLNLPRSVHFPKLKLLTLRDVRIKDKYFIERLLSNCPVLEQLSLGSCTWDDIADLCI